MPPLTTPLVVSDLIQRAHELRESEDGWEPFRDGVTAQWLYQEEGDGARAVLLRYEPGARVAVHEHVGYEHLLILDGDQYDEDGSYPTGASSSTARDTALARQPHRLRRAVDL